MLRVHRQRLNFFHERYRRQGYMLAVISYHDLDSGRWLCKVGVFVSSCPVRSEVLGGFDTPKDAIELRDEARTYLNNLAAPGSADRAAKGGRVEPSSGHAPAVEIH